MTKKRKNIIIKAFGYTSLPIRIDWTKGEAAFWCSTIFRKSTDLATKKVRITIEEIK